MIKKLTVALIAALVLLAVQTSPGFACGGLVAPDGDVRLDRAATLVAWHNGVEHYLTSFSYQGEASNIGWIVPLPAVPDKIEAGGAWTLQRLFRESHPESLRLSLADAAPTTAQSAQVLQQVKVEALDVTVLRGTGKEVLNWASKNSFYLDFETRAHLLNYANGSPIFMAAKYDTAAAKARHQITGNGVPLLITMKTAHPWVPLEVLALGSQQVQADLYFLTDKPLNISDLNMKLGQSPVGQEIPGAKGLKIAFQEKMNQQLYKDLSSDRNMSWVWPESWFTYLSLDAPGHEVTYDMGINEAGVIRLAPYGTAPMAVIDQARSQELPGWLPALPLGALQWIAGFLVVGTALLLLVRWQRRSKLAR